jgi:hypothetical protein
MQHTKRSLEGYLLIDNSANQGGVVEVPTLTCSHCHRQVLVNPGRTREREYCGNCDHYICDSCGLAKKVGASCVTMNQILDQAQAAAFRQEQASRGAIGAPAIVLTDS